MRERRVLQHEDDVGAMGRELGRQRTDARAAGEHRMHLATAQVGRLAGGRHCLEGHAPERTLA